MNKKIIPTVALESRSSAYFVTGRKRKEKRRKIHSLTESTPVI